jgi:hypothetical protein
MATTSHAGEYLTLFVCACLTPSLPSPFQGEE